MWSKDKEQLEERLAPSLEKKIVYIMEAGHKTTWGATYKVEIRYMGKPVIKFGEGMDYMVSHYEVIERSQLTEIKWTKEETHQLFLKAQLQLWNEGTYTTSMFFIGMKEYLSLSISDALKHTQWAIRLFAILDKRCGKRTLIKIAEEINSYPEPIREIYLIRLENEGISYRKNENGEIYIGA